ncbi:MAG: hypothetical protein AAF609_01440 [Cyanobacteria bacterium P01_C01_bin.120]
MSRIVRWVITGALGGLVLAGAVLFTAAVANKDSSGVSAVTILSQLESTYERTREQANLPVLLPTEFPELGPEFWLSEYIGNEGSQYTLSVDVESGCEGAGACSRGSMGGEIVTADTEPVEEIYSFLNEPLDDPNRPRSDDPMGDVELINGLEGFFVPWIATAQCSEAQVYWEQPSASSDETYRYYVGIECGDRAEVVELANNVIANTEGF